MDGNDVVWHSTVKDVRRMEDGDLMFLVRNGVAKKVGNGEASSNVLWDVGESRKHSSCYDVFLSRAIGPRFVEKKARIRIWYDETVNTARVSMKMLDFLILYSALWDEEENGERERKKAEVRYGEIQPWRVPVESGKV